MGLIDTKAEEEDREDERMTNHGFDDVKNNLDEEERIPVTYKASPVLPFSPLHTDLRSRSTLTSKHARLRLRNTPIYPSPSDVHRKRRAKRRTARIMNLPVITERFAVTFEGTGQSQAQAGIDGGRLVTND